MELWRRYGGKVGMTLSSQRLLRFFFLFGGFAKVDLHVPSSLVRAREPSSTSVASKRLLAGVGANMGCEVVGSREVTHTDAALERLLASMSPHVAGEFVGARETSNTRLDRATIRTFTGRRLRSFRELVFTFHLQDATACLHGSAVVHYGFVQLGEAVVVVVVGGGGEEVVRCGVQKFVEVSVEFQVRGELIGVANKRPFHVHGGGGLKVGKGRQGLRFLVREGRLLDFLIRLKELLLLLQLLKHGSRLGLDVVLNAT